MQKPFHPPATVDVHDLVIKAYELLRSLGWQGSSPAGDGWRFTVDADAHDQLLKGVIGGQIGPVYGSETLPPSGLSRVTLFGVPVEVSEDLANNEIRLSYGATATFEVTL